LSQIPLPGETQEKFHSTTLVPEVVANIVAMTTEIVASTQTTDLAASSGARESFIATLVDGISVVTSVPETAIDPDSVSMSVCKAPVVTP